MAKTGPGEWEGREIGAGRGGGGRGGGGRGSFQNLPSDSHMQQMGGGLDPGTNVECHRPQWVGPGVQGSQSSGAAACELPCGH